MKRAVTEHDFRKPEFKDANPEDYEFRDDGAVVRKDRWQTGMRNIVCALGLTREDFEINDVVNIVKQHILNSKRYEFIKSKMEVRSCRTDLPLYPVLHWHGYSQTDTHDVLFVDIDDVVDNEIMDEQNQ